MKRVDVPKILAIEESLCAIEHAENALNRCMEKIRCEARSRFTAVGVTIEADRDLCERLYESYQLPTAIFMETVRNTQEVLQKRKAALLKELKEF